MIPGPDADPAARGRTGAGGAPLRITGTQELKLDDKGRLVLGKGFREALQPECWVRGDKDRLTAWPYALWAERDAKLAAAAERILEEVGFDDEDERYRAAVERRSSFNYHGRFVKVDANGRLTLPSELRGHASLSINANVRIAGTGDKLELWAPAVWARHQGRT